MLRWLQACDVKISFSQIISAFYQQDHTNNKQNKRTYQAVCQTILIISKGKIVAQDTPENLSRLVAEYETVEMTLISEPQAVIDVLSKLEGLSYGVLPMKDPGKVKVTIRGDKDVDIRSMVATALAQARIAIIDMNTISASLEDIFLRLTGNAKKPAVKKAEQTADEAQAEDAPAEETTAGGEDK